MITLISILLLTLGGILVSVLSIGINGVENTTFTRIVKILIYVVAIVYAVYCGQTGTFG